MILRRLCRFEESGDQDRGVVINLRSIHLLAERPQEHGPNGGKIVAGLDNAADRRFVRYQASRLRRFGQRRQIGGQGSAA